MLARKDPSLQPVVRLIELLVAGPQADAAAAQRCLALLAERVQTREIVGDRLTGLKSGLEPLLGPVLAGPADQPLYLDAALLATTLGSANGSVVARKIYLTTTEPVRTSSAGG